MGVRRVKVLHTSDWHLGQSFYGHDRTFEHEMVLGWLAETLESEEIDALLVAGDVFDNANPSAASQRLFYGFLSEAKRRLPSLRVVIIAGNHDSPGRLEAPSPLFRALDTSVVGQARRLSDGSVDCGRMVMPLADRDGRVKAWCMAVPFLRPGDLPRVETDADAYGQGVSLLYREVLESARARRHPGQAILAMGHCHMRGAQVSEESERRIVIGGAEALGSEVFGGGIAYAALGHFHRAQAVGGAEHVRYSGSPLPLAFAETGYPHQVVVITLVGESVESIRPVRVPRPVGLLRVPSEPAPVDDALDALASLSLQDLPEQEWPYLQVRVALTGPEPGLRPRIESVIEGRQVRLARIETVYPTARGTIGTSAPLSLDDLARLQPDTVFRRLHDDRCGEEPAPELMAALGEALRDAGDTTAEEPRR
jgi:exonuclease SbcD